MEFLKNFLRNLFMLGVIGLILYLIAPDMIGMVYDFFGQLFGPLAILMLIASALPQRRRKRSH